MDWNIYDNEVEEDMRFDEGGCESLDEEDSSKSHVSMNLNIDLVEEMESYYDESSNELHTPQDSDGEDEVTGPEFRSESDINFIQFSVGMRFSSPKVLKEAIKKYAITKAYNVKLIKNDKIRVTAICSGERKWRLHASVIQNDNTIQIKKYEGCHTCCRDFQNRNMNSTWIAKTYLERFKDQPDWSLVEVIEAVRKDFEVNISRSQTYRARKKALIKINGSLVEQYKRLWDYAEEIRRANEGSTVKIQCDRLGEENGPVFRRFYMCLKACKEGFQAGCRPFIDLDACHLKGPCQGQLMAAVGVDGNNSFYPIAWAVVEAETKDSWTWFLTFLQDDIGHFESKGYTFISDQQKGLVPTFDDIFPNVPHRFCVSHLYANFKKMFKGLALKNSFWNAAKCTNRRDFDEEMVELGKLNVEAYQYLMGIPAKFWSRHVFSSTSKCDFLLNNIFESINSLILQARSKPIIQLLETIRKLVMIRITKKYVVYSNMKEDFGYRIVKKLEKCKSLSRKTVPIWAGNMMFEVAYGDTQFVVDLDKRTCSCRKWDLSGIPCPHSIQCIYYVKRKPEEFLDESYSKQTQLNIYSHFVQPLNGPPLWPMTIMQPLLPPTIRRPPGRPKKQRKRDVDEVGPSRTRTKIQPKSRCSKCKSVDHNSRTCKGSIGKKATSSRRRNAFMGFNISSTELATSNIGTYLSHLVEE